MHLVFEFLQNVLSILRAHAPHSRASVGTSCRKFVFNWGHNWDTWKLICAFQKKSVMTTRQFTHNNPASQLEWNCSRNFLIQIFFVLQNIRQVAYIFPLQHLVTSWRLVTSSQVHKVSQDDLNVTCVLKFFFLIIVFSVFIYQQVGRHFSFPLLKLKNVIKIHWKTRFCWSPPLAHVVTIMFRAILMKVKENQFNGF